MLDRWSIKLLKTPLDWIAKRVKKSGYSPDQITFAAFVLGMGALPALYLHMYWLALACILLNRIGDGLDGALARMTRTSDAGGFLDIVLDFIFYSAVVFGFALAEPDQNSLAAAFLIFSFVGTGSSFLAYAIMAERRSLSDLRLPEKGFYYLGGLAEGTETIIFFILICLFPSFFPALAWIFGSICLLGTAARIVYGYRTLD